MESETTASGKPEGQIQIVAQSHCKSGSWVVTKIVIEGKHKGSLKCDHLKIASSAQIQADVSATTMATESGARVVGKVNITGGQ